MDRHTLRNGLAVTALSLAVALNLGGCTDGTPQVAPLAAAATTQPANSTGTATTNTTDTGQNLEYPLPVNKSIRRSATVVSVTDGDTIVVDTHNRISPDTVITIRTKIRIAQINTPELKSKVQSEREAAAAARNRTQQLLPIGTRVVIYDLGPEKYGRTLAQVNTPDGINVGETLLREGLAKPVNY